jgi:hypothetical protein
MASFPRQVCASIPLLSEVVLTCLAELYEARAILLGRLGRHDQALESYVYRLHDYIKAEEYGYFDFSLQ